jgi:hypothetical protein
MKTEWFVAKYMPDLRRREPTNVGVILRMDDAVLARFLGERSDGRIDGRSVKWLGIASYKAWVAYWRQHLDASADVSLLTTTPAGANYFVEVGGERLIGSESTDPEALLDYLYSVLVEETPEREKLSVEKATESVLNRIEIADRVERGYVLEVPRDGFTDRVEFDYRFHNGIAHLMQRVSLTLEDVRSWDNVHAAAWSFQHARGVDHKASAIALVRTREQDVSLDKQMRLLGEYASVVDVGHTEEAAERLSDLLHLGPASKLR